MARSLKFSLSYLQGGVLCFREKLSRRKLIALGMILAALVLLNLKGGA